jgi:hypothetical protein
MTKHKVFAGNNTEDKIKACVRKSLLVHPTCNKGNIMPPSVDQFVLPKFFVISILSVFLCVYDYKAAKKLKNNRLERKKMQKKIHKPERTMEKTQMNP